MTDKPIPGARAGPDAAGPHDCRELDVRGLNCPLPVLKARKLLKAMQPGQRLRVLATDPRAPADMAELCAATGWGLIESGQEGEAFAFLLERR